MTFFLSAAFGLFGAIITWVFLPDTTGLSLDELDRLHKYMLTEEWEHYHGEAVNPRHLSIWERHVLKWDRHYSPSADAAHMKVQLAAVEQHKKEAKGSRTGSTNGAAAEQR